MKLVVVGPGALGCLLAARLKQADACRVSLLDHRPQRAAALNRQGIILAASDAAPAAALPVPVYADPAAIRGAEAVVFCLKSFALPQALAAAIPFVGPDTLLVIFANGIGHAEAGRRLGEYCRPALGICTAGATQLAPGQVRAGGPGRLTLGYAAPQPGSSWQDKTDPLARVAQGFRRAGFETRLNADIERELWLKLLVNVGINALTVVHDCPNGRLLEIPAARRQMAQAVEEAAAVARAHDIILDADPLATVEEVCRRTATNISSMLQDVRHRRPTEIMAINGEIVRRANILGFTAPANEALTRAVKQRHPDQ